MRTLLCFLADDIGTLEQRDLSLAYVEERMSADAADLGPRLARVFQVLDALSERSPEPHDEHLSGFPHVDGDPFSEPLGHLPVALQRFWDPSLMVRAPSEDHLVAV